MLSRRNCCNPLRPLRWRCHAVANRVRARSMADARNPFDLRLSAGFRRRRVRALLRQEARGQFGKTVITENKVGAFGNIATEYVAKSKPDGYTLFIAPGSSFLPPRRACSRNSPSIRSTISNT